MKKQTKVLLLSIALCMIFALGVFCVFAVKNFSFGMGGTIKFIAPGINATISNATLTGISKESGSGQMSEFTITQSMTAEQIQDLDGYKSWSGLKLLFDENSDGKAKLSFDITNNSSKAIENIMVELSTNTSHSSPVVVTPSADFCIAPGASHTFDIDISVKNTDLDANLDDFNVVVKLDIIKPEQVLSQEEHLQTTGLNFTTNSSAKTAVFSKYTTPTGATALADGLEVEIPAVIKDTNGNLYTVTEIKSGNVSSSGAFYSLKTTLTKITMPNTLTKIGNYAFYQCTALSGDLIIPNSVTSIGDAAFYGCSGLSGELIIPSGVTSIGSGAFAICSGLTSVEIPNSVTSIGSSAFSNCSGFTGELIIPSSVTSIESSAFSRCSGLSGDLIIPSGVTSIGGSAFYRCSGFTGKLEIPSGVTSIGEYAFSGCKGLTGNLVIPSGVTSIADFAFSDCSGLSGELIIPSSVTSIGEYAFDGCSGLSGDLIIPSSVTTIGDMAFYSCKGLTGNLVIPSGVTSIGDHAFSYCSGLTSVEISSGVTSIGQYAFDGCSGLTSVEIPSSVTSIGNYAFYNCSKLTSITVSATTPPTLMSTICFYLTNNCPIYVPAECVDAYKTATNWSEYASRIVAIPA